MKAFQYSVNTIEPYNPTPSANLLMTGTLLQNLTITKGERKAYSSSGLPNKSTEGHEWLLTDTRMVDAITYFYKSTANKTQNHTSCSYPLLHEKLAK